MIRSFCFVVATLWRVTLIFFFFFPCLINWGELFKGLAIDQADTQAVFYQVLLYTLCLFSQIQKHALENQTLPQLSLTAVWSLFQIC